MLFILVNYQKVLLFTIATGIVALVLIVVENQRFVAVFVVGGFVFSLFKFFRPENPASIMAALWYPIIIFSCGYALSCFIRDIHTFIKNRT